MGLKNFIKSIPGVMTVRNLQLAYSAPYTVRKRCRRDIKQLKNKYLGKRCFIIGNGPSLKAEDLDKLENEITFAANKIYLIFEQTKWRPTFYCVQDEHVLLDMDEEKMHGIAGDAESVFIRMQSYKKLCGKTKKLEKTIYVPIWNRPRKEWGSLFTKKADKYVYDGSTVTFFAMQLAAYMGFESIYLLGVDNSCPYRIERDGTIIENDSKLKMHFFDGQAGDFPADNMLFKANYQGYADNSYVQAEKYSRKDGTFRIYNATRGGKLEIFERVDFDEVVRHEA